MTGSGAQPGLYRQLILRLLVPMLVLVSCGGALGIYAAGRLTSEVFDRWLLDAAVSLAQQVTSDGKTVTVDLPHASQSMLAYDEIDRTFYAVENQGRLLVGVAGIAQTGAHMAAYASGQAFDGRIGNQAVRIAMSSANCAGCSTVRVLVAETLRKRERVEQNILWLFSPMILVLAATLLAIVIAVRKTVQPLEKLADQWNRESHESLKPISPGNLPRELLPFSTALNDLLDRIRRMLVRERRFAAAAAHQLRTPLAALRLGLDRARRAPDLDATRAVLDELDVSTDHTARMIQQLLLLGRIDPDHSASVELKETDLGDLVRDVCSALSDLAFAKRIDVDFRTPPGPVLVSAQFELLSEAVANLLDNALKASPTGSQVQVTVFAEPPSMRILDSGPGISTSEQSAVFEHFVRGIKTDWPGSGLGLSIVRDIAKLHRASVRFSTPESGRGACVTFEFDARSPRP